MTNRFAARRWNKILDFVHKSAVVSCLVISAVSMVYTWGGHYLYLKHIQPEKTKAMQDKIRDEVMESLAQEGLLDPPRPELLVDEKDE